MRKLVGLFAGAAILVAACGGTSTTTAPASTAPSAAPAQSSGPSASAAAPSAAAGPVDLFGTKYAPADATSTAGTVIIGDWQEATQFNPYYLGQVTEANVASLVWHSLLTITDDFKYAPQLAAEPIPTTENGGVKVPGDNGDAMTVTWKLRDGLKWSDGEPLTCDDFKYAYEWVTDPDNVGVVLTGFDDMTGFDCPTATDMVLALQERLRGLPDPDDRAPAAPLPVQDPDQGPGQRRRLPPGRDRQDARARTVQVRVGDAAGRASPRAQRQLPEPPHRQAGEPRRRRVQVVRRSGRDDRGLPERRDRPRVRPPGLGPPEGPGPR